jgi:hypothetical protein
MKRDQISIILLILAWIASFNGTAQDNQTLPAATSAPDNRFFTGGSIGLQFGNQTMIDASPILGYRITKNFSAGVGFTYQYYRLNYYNTILQTYIIGGRVFARYYFFENFFLHGEYEALNLETKFFDPGFLYHQSDRYWVGSVLAGGGYRQAIGENSFFNIMVLYNLNDTPYGPYDNPWIFRVGVDIGL